MISAIGKRSQYCKFYKLEDYPDELIEKHSVYQANPQKFSKEYYEELFEEIKNKGNDEEI